MIAELEKPATTHKERTFHEHKNEEFHNLIVELSGNRKLMETYRTLNAHIKIARIHYSREGWAQRMEKEEKEEHRQILHALEARNRDRLIRSLRHHIQRAHNVWSQTLKRLERGNIFSLANL